MKPHIFVLLAFLVLLGVIVSPVFAYTDIQDLTVSHSSCGGVMSLNPLRFQNATSITKVEWTGDLFQYNTSRATGTVTTLSIKNDSCYGTDESKRIANVTLNWAFNAGTGDDDTYTMLIDWKPGVSNVITDGYLCYNNAPEDTAPGYPAPILDCYGTPTPSSYTYSLIPHSGSNLGEGSYKFYTGSAVNTPLASFTCTPTSQYPDSVVTCTDTSTNTPTDWYWTLDAEGWGQMAWQTSSSRNFTWQSHYPGLYSVNLKANNSAGFDWENKSSYVSISANATPNTCSVPVVPGLIRSMAQCVDSQTNGAIGGCDLSLLDKEGGAWSNVTDRFDGTWCIDTYPGHHIDAYGWADSYTPSPSSRLNLPASDTVMYELLMHPGYIPPAASGKVWIYVLVNDADTGAALADAHVSISGSGQVSKSDYTGASGQIMIQWANVSTAYVTASKSGYTSGSQTLTTSSLGPDTVRIELHRGTINPTATLTTGPGGTVPTTASPWATPGPEGTMPSGYTNAQGQRMMDLLAMHGYDLVMLCIMVTIMALLGVKLGK